MRDAAIPPEGYRLDVTTGGDGYFTPGHSGTLKAILTAQDGSEDILMKEITVR